MKRPNRSHGETHWNARLTDAQVREIRALRKTGCACCGNRLSQEQIGHRFGISHVAVHMIVSGKAWSHVSDVEAA